MCALGRLAAILLVGEPFVDKAKACQLGFLTGDEKGRLILSVYVNPVIMVEKKCISC